MAFNPMNDFNSAYQTATNVELARQEANRRAVATNSQIKAQNIIDDKNMQELKELRYNFDRKQREDDIVDMNECADALARGDVMAANWMIANNSRLRSNVEQFGFRGSFMGHKEINPTLHQSTKEALARELGVTPEELSDNDIVYTQGDNGMPQAQYMPFWTPYIPKREGWLQAKNYQTALQTLDVSQKTANLGKTQAETQNTQAKAKGQQIQNEVDIDKGAVIQAALDAWGRGEDTNAIFQDLNNFMAATKGDLEQGGLKPTDAMKVLKFNQGQKQQDTLNKAGSFFGRYMLQEGMKQESAIQLANNDYMAYKKQKQITGPLTTKQATEIMAELPGLKGDVESMLGTSLSTNARAKLTMSETLGLQAMMAAGVSPSDTGWLDDKGNWVRENFGIDLTKKPEELKALRFAGLLGTALNARNNSYMSKSEINRLLSIVASSGKDYVANLESLQATYQQNLNTIGTLTRGVYGAEVIYAPLREATEQALAMTEAMKVAYDVDSDAPNEVAATKYVKMSDGKMHLMVAFPPEDADPNQDYSQVPDDSPIWYTLVGGKLVNSQGKVYGGK